MKVSDLGSFIKQESAKVISGQEEVIEQMLVCLLCRGHVLLEGVPGIAKTLIAKTISHIIGCDFKRVQFTPDLMPSDITGTNIFDSKVSEFRLKKGPIFTNILLADEINRTPPRTQSALLQAMEERNVTIDGVDCVFEGLFFVAATQNPIEYEGTYPLPEAQLDRFLMKIVMTYPSREEELEVVRRNHEGFDPHNLNAANLKQLPDLSVFNSAWDEVTAVKADPQVINYAAEIARKTREEYRVLLGASPRASVALLKCGKALAALRGRDFVTPDDIKSLAVPILVHRLIMSPESVIENVTANEIVASVLAQVPVPR